MTWLHSTTQSCHNRTKRSSRFRKRLQPKKQRKPLRKQEKQKRHVRQQKQQRQRARQKLQDRQKQPQAVLQIMQQRQTTHRPAQEAPPRQQHRLTEEALTMILRPAIPAARMIPAAPAAPEAQPEVPSYPMQHSLLEIHTYGAAQALPTELTALVLS